MESSVLAETLARLAPGTPLRQAVERIIQQGNGALVVLGHDPSVDAASSGGFQLQGVSFSTARLAELAKMDGGIVLDDTWDRILSANVHFLPDPELPTDETGSRHRTAERLAQQTGKPILAVSEGRRLATLFFEGRKIELVRPNVLAARASQDLHTLERLRRRLDDSDERLTILEAGGLATYRNVVVVLQQGEVLRRIGRQIEGQTINLGGEARLLRVQLGELTRGVDQLVSATLSDYLVSRRQTVLGEAEESLAAMRDEELEDSTLVGKVLGFAELDEGAQPRGVRLLSRVARLPETTREQLLRRFKSVDRLASATAAELELVEGIGAARAAMLRRYFDRWRAAAQAWDTDPA